MAKENAAPAPLVNPETAKKAYCTTCGQSFYVIPGYRHPLNKKGECQECETRKRSESRKKALAKKG